MRKESHHFSQVHQVQQHETTLTSNLQKSTKRTSSFNSLYDPSGFLISLINILQPSCRAQLRFPVTPSAVLQNCDKITRHPYFFVQLNYSNFQTRCIFEENTTLLNYTQLCKRFYYYNNINYNFQQKQHSTLMQ